LIFAVTEEEPEHATELKLAVFIELC
jgi:hypothetical protein